MMKQIIGRLKWCVSQTAMLMAVLLCCSACDSMIYDDEGDCDPHYFVRFVYDMNMLRTDAFATQVTSVDLYVFNEQTGECVAHIPDKGEALSTGNYRMPLDIAPGKYKLIAWCGLADNEDHFTVPQTFAKHGDLVCTMTRNYDGSKAYSENNLYSLFHGMVSVEFPNTEGEHEAVIKLTKDTNNINLSLNHYAGPLDPDDFEITMTDENGLMAHDNSLMADELIEYRPYRLRSGTTGVQRAAADGSDSSQEIGVLVAELSTARLMTDHEMRINIVSKADGKTVFSIPLVQWALLLRSAKHGNMEAQEYLDREDEYDLMVFLDENNKEGWSAMEIYINGWHLVTDEKEL